MNFMTNDTHRCLSNHAKSESESTGNPHGNFLWRFACKRPAGWMLVGILILIGAGLILRFADLEADPPVGLSPSAGFYFDGHANAHGARSYVRFGNLRPDEWDTFIYSPTYTLLQIPWFRVWGTGLWSINAFAAFWASCAMLLGILLFRHEGRWACLFAACFFCFEFISIHLGRVGLFENLMIVFMLAAVVSLGSRRYPRAGAFFAGFFAAAAMATKFIIPYFFVAVWLGVVVAVIRPGEAVRKRLSVFLGRSALFAAGILAVFIPWLLLFRIPNSESFQGFGAEWTSGFLPESFSDLLQSVATTPIFFSMGKVHQAWILALPALVAVGALIVLRPRALSATGVALAAWLVGGGLFIATFKSPALRYVYPILPALYGCITYGFILFIKSRKIQLNIGPAVLWIDVLSILAGLILIRFYVYYRLPVGRLLPGILPRVWELLLLSLALSAAGWGVVRLLFWALFRSSFPLHPWIKAAVLTACLGYFFLANTRAHGFWFRQRDYSIVTVSRRLGETYPNMIIAGTSACTAVVENDAVAIRVSRPKWNNWERPFERFGITHTYITDYAGETGRFFALYPEAMNKARFMESVVVCGFTYHIYELPHYRDADAPIGQP